MVTTTPTTQQQAATSATLVDNANYYQKPFARGPKNDRDSKRDRQHEAQPINRKRKLEAKTGCVHVHAYKSTSTIFSRQATLERSCLQGWWVFNASLNLISKKPRVRRKGGREGQRGRSLETLRPTVMRMQAGNNVDDDADDATTSSNTRNTTR